MDSEQRQLECPDCGYLLHGLVGRSDWARCPECGGWASIRGMAAHLLDRRRLILQRMHRTMLLLAFGLVLLVGAALDDTTRFSAWFDAARNLAPQMLAGVITILTIPLWVIASWLAPERTGVLRLAFAGAAAALLVFVVPPYGVIGVASLGFAMLRA